MKKKNAWFSILAVGMSSSILVPMGGASHGTTETQAYVGGNTGGAVFFFSCGPDDPGVGIGGEVFCTHPPPPAQVTIGIDDLVHPAPVALARFRAPNGALLAVEPVCQVATLNVPAGTGSVAVIAGGTLGFAGACSVGPVTVGVITVTWSTS